MPDEVTPHSFEEAAAALAAAGERRRAVRIVGGATKQSWGRAVRPPELVVHSAGLDRIVEHNRGDLTAVIEAGVPLDRAQRQFAAAGQMLALDPFLGPARDATIGGIVATADSGPLRHRYGAPRDLVVGITVALSDGTIARSGGKVIKNVAGYDLAKLFAGSFGTLGMILSVSVRLHPLPAASATALGVSGDPEVLAGASRLLAAAPLELEALDVAWRGGRGGVLARSGGVQARGRAEHVATVMRGAGLDDVEIADDDAELWARQRAGQRSEQAALVRVAAPPSELVAVLRAAHAANATLVGRVTLGHSFVELDPGAIGALQRRLPVRSMSVLLDAPEAARPALGDPWGGSAPDAALDLMRKLKARFDPAAICNPGVFVGGI